MLGLEIQVHKDRLRFYDGTALLLESEGLMHRLQELYDEAQERAEDEAQRRVEAERELARLREELERLKR